MRAAFQHLAGNADLRLAGIVALRLRAAARILGHAARLGRVGGMAGRPEIRGPLPHIADHVAEPVTVRRKRPDWRGALETVLLEVLVREVALPGVRHLLTPGRELFAPGIFRPGEPAPRREFP